MDETLQNWWTKRQQLSAIGFYGETAGQARQDEMQEEQTEEIGKYVQSIDKLTNVLSMLDTIDTGNELIQERGELKAKIFAIVQDARKQNVDLPESIILMEKRYDQNQIFQNIKFFEEDVQKSVY